MAFDRSFLDELSARCDIVDIVSRYVQLKKSGANYFGLCPFHNEKSPSFSVAPDKQIFHCFGCGAGGGVITFIMRAEGLEFPDAVRFLAKEAGMQVPEEKNTDPREANKRERLLAISKDAARFFYEQLWKPENTDALQYFINRGISRKTLNKFGLGYAPDSFHALLDAMTAKGYYKEELIDAGLVAKSEKGRVYDKFRNRVMFPIIDIRGDVIAFGGRVMDDSKPKYLNSPETMIFHKGRNLFAMNFARKTKSESFLLAEGYMDVIALHQAGFDAAVASLGTALTEEQARLISRHTGQIVICYDADGAGQMAAQRAIDILQKAGLSVRVLKIPGAKDPDEFIKAKGADAFQNLLERSENHNVYRLENLADKYDLQEDAERISFLRDAARMVAGIEGAIEREVYAGRAAKMAGVTPEAMKVEVERELKIRVKRQKSAEQRQVRAPIISVQPKDRALRYEDVRSARAEEGVLRLIFADDTLLDALGDTLTPEIFTAPVLQKIYTHALALYHAGRMVSVPSFEGVLTEGELAHLVRILNEQEPTDREKREMALQDYLRKMENCRLRAEVSAPAGGEDPLLRYSRLHTEKKKTGGN